MLWQRFECGIVYALWQMIRLYQCLLAPWLGASCRYRPSCSHYAQMALLRLGLLGGVAAAMRRLLRCRPFGPSGYDPVRGRFTNFLEKK